MHPARIIVHEREYAALMGVAMFWNITEEEVLKRCGGDMKKLLQAYESAKELGALPYSHCEFIAEELDLDPKTVWDYYTERPGQLDAAVAKLIRQGRRPRNLRKCVVSIHDDIREQEEWDERGDHWVDTKRIEIVVVA